MVEEIARDTGVEIAELVGDMAYGDGDTRSAPAPPWKPPAPG